MECIPSWSTLNLAGLAVPLLCILVIGLMARNIAALVA